MVLRKELKKCEVLVTGGAGFIGSHLIDRLLLDGVKKIIVVDNFFTGSKENLSNAMISDQIILYSEDAEIYSSLNYIFDSHNIDVVFNCATKALNYSFVNPSNAFSTNVDVILNLLELQRSNKFSTLCHFSTSEVYGSALYEPMDEFHPKNPTTTYAAGKAAADMAIEAYVKMFNLDAIILRPFNNYGPRQNYEGPLAGVIPKTINNILRGDKPEIHGDGSQTRDFVFVSDTVDAVIKLYYKLNRGETVNISAANEISIINLLKIMSSKLKYNDEFFKKPLRNSDVRSHKADNSKLKSLIDFSPTSFEVGLEKTIDFYKKIIVGS